MAAEKKVTKKTVKEAAVKKPVAAKPAKPVAAKPAAVKKPAAKATPVVKKTESKPVAAKAKAFIPQERFYAMVSEAAYFSAQNDGNRKSSSEYWLEAEDAVRTRFDIA